MSGRRLAKPVTFSFTTPTVKLLNTTRWYRRGGTVDGRMVAVLLRSISRSARADVAPH